MTYRVKTASRSGMNETAAINEALAKDGFEPHKFAACICTDTGILIAVVKKESYAHLICDALNHGAH